MEENLKELLKAENDVNRRVQEALNRKNQMLRSIKESGERDVTAFRVAKEKEYQIEYDKVSRLVTHCGIAQAQDRD